MVLIAATLSNIDIELPVPEYVCVIVFMNNKTQTNMLGVYKPVFLHIITCYSINN